ncbi:MAG TPA: LAGLIDADG family homing endonuclease [Candidatus Acidoferrum sp.]|nr:LAGLIDADG family homing endonuclease [Candidatus Acidoferrum sp.]
MKQITITPKLCEFVGALIGDGHMWTDGSRFRIGLTGHPKLDLNYYNYLSDVAYELFGKRPYKFKVRYGGLRFTLQQKEAFLFLKSIGLPSGPKAKTITIPKSIIEKGWGCTSSTVRGIFDTDGTVFFSKKTYEESIYPTVEISTTSGAMAQQLRDILDQHFFRVHKREQIRKDGTGSDYHISVYGTKMLEKWFNEIGSSNSRHMDKFLKYKKSYKGDINNRHSYAAIAQWDSVNSATL